MNNRKIFSEERKFHDLAQAQSLIGKNLAGVKNVQYYFESEKVTDDIGDIESVSYTHLTLPTIYSV